jgi:hypothetical protein
MSDQFPVFEVVLEQRRRGWTWRVCRSTGDVVLSGKELSRSAAQYVGYRSLFMLLRSAPYQVMPPKDEKTVRPRSGPRRSLGEFRKDRPSESNFD